MKALRLALYLLVAAVLALLILLGGLGVWSGASTSLATSLNQLTRFLPAGQTLEVKNVTGSLRGGGGIGWLRWQRGELSVEAREVSVAWGWRSLLDGDLRLGQLAVGQLRIDDRRTSAAPMPPTELNLPIKVDAPISVATLEWVGPPALKITGLKGHYTFDHKDHRLDIQQAQMSSGSYRLKGRLQAQAPMMLSLQLDGSLHASVPAGGQAVTVQAHATIEGPLAGRDATLALQARLRPELKAAPGQAMQADVTARLQPWQPQAVVQANAQWQALDLAALWPQAPRTRLDGEASVTPAGPDWRGDITLKNSLSGPWDKQRLPLERLNAKLVFVAEQWNIESLQAMGAGGRIEAQGKLTRTPMPSPNQATNNIHWQGSATAQGINPAALDSRLAATALDGQLTARQAGSGISFNVQLQPAKGKVAAPRGASLSVRTLDGLRLKSVQAQGLWQAPALKLNTLAVQTEDAQLQGRLTLDSTSRATEGDLTLSLPGANAALAGQIASSRGLGKLSLNVTDAALAARWLRRWPGLGTALGDLSPQGAATLTGSWQGGWQHQGQGLALQATLRAPRLDLRTSDQPADTPWRLRDGQAELSGTLRALKLSVQGQAENATRRFALQAQAQGGRLSDGVWQATVDTAQLSAQDSLRPGLWTLQLGAPLALDWKQGANAYTLNASAGAAHLRGPVPGTASVNWQAANWSRQMTGQRSQWQTQGQLQGVPLAWLELLGQTQIANLGLRGDLLFGGQWDATSSDTLRLRATLARSSGDLQLQTTETDGKAGTLITAGVREARLTLSSDGTQVAASLRWDSERAGQTQAEFSTRLQQQEGSWTWPLDAPLAGTLRAQLPPVGAWSLLAPPGWRLRGTLDANAMLAGTRAAPLWRGTLRAQDVAVRSVVDGIDFSRGTLNATLDGQRLEIQELKLQGAGGDSGGRLSVKGAVTWLPATGPAAAVLSRLRMELDATAQALRVSTRADRRLVVSGQLTARLADTRLSVRGALKADQALFILPEDTAPQLGDDVRVRAPDTSPARATASTTPAPGTTVVRVTPDVAITLDPGPDFQVRGRGLVTRLAGSLELRSATEQRLMPRLSGELRTVRGTYKAYGQQLDIEEGVLRFFGPYDNPALDILAIRPNLQQRVGVQISGTALSPVIRLYAEPDLPDAEKLSWLVLGHSSANGGAETAVLQQAALALLGGRGKGLSGGLAEALGLDELSVRGLAGNSDGSTSATVTLGKRVSRDFYVAYERSLAGTLGTFFIFYDLSRRFTLRAQTGEQSAVDLIFTLRYD
jgi:translocation and assembly module TamB